MNAFARLSAAISIILIGVTSCASSGPVMDPNEAPVTLSPCPRSPNCVSSHSTAKRHRIAPLTYSTDSASAYRALLKVIADRKEATIVTEQPNYIHAEFTSRLFRFVDDVEFLFDPGQPVIHVRSASRSGYYDFGLNRKRVESLREQFSTVLEKM
jgi:uncharacterized protein (DUF1499 family)